MVRRRSPAVLVMAGFLASAVGSAVLAGIPEPSLVLYGVVQNRANNSRLTTGPIEWLFQPASGGSAVAVSGTLRNVNDQFSYVLFVPCETPLPGESASTNTLQLASPPITYDLSQVTIGGVTASFAMANLSQLPLGPDDRGRTLRIDLEVTLVVNDSDGNGLPDDWELAHFGHIGVDPSGDPDNDGLSNEKEWKAGTDPNDFQSQFAILRISNNGNPGIQIEWSSVTDRTYSVLRSTDLTQGFVPIQTGIGATPPSNIFQDATAVGAGPYFYLLQVEE